MERLTYNAKDQNGNSTGNVWYNAMSIKTGECIFPKDYKEENVLKKLASYEDAEEQGLLVRLPCKVGDTVWVIRTAVKTGAKSIHRGEVVNFTLGTDSAVLIVNYEFFGTEEGYFKWNWNAFSSKEAAEAALTKENMQ